jgi:hypothetical protein
MRAGLIGAGLLLLAGCHKHKDPEGPVQRAGKGIDNAAEKTGDALHRAAVKTDAAAQKAVHATGEAFERAGQKLKGTPRATQPASEPKKTAPE